MLAVMKHRAPDDTGIVSDGEFSIGMGRLKILDLDSPNLCPIVDGNLVLTFNGEIYNYEELKEELTKLGHEFHTQSDSEVLLKAYKQWGTGCLDKLNGMFAFAIYDGQTIFLARDIAGEKPLYYRKSDFAFASEAKALGKCIEFPCAHYGIYKGIHLELHRYWFPPSTERDVDLATAIGELDVLLQSAVSLRTRAHVPYGLYYSGGIDSALISTYHNFEHQYTYEDKSEYKTEFLQTFKRILWHLDYPVKTFSAFGLWKLAEEASKEVKVVLSGEGADELFGGYVRYVPNEFNRLARKEFPSYTGLFPYKDMLREEFHGNMRELLRMGDRMAGAWGIENRCPFLDRRIIEFAMSLPIRFKIDGFKTKVVLRELLKRRNPSYRFEEKRGLYVSINKWLGERNQYGKGTYLAYQKKLMGETRLVASKKETLDTGLVVSNSPQ